LGVYVHGFYFQNQALAAVNYASIVFAVLIYIVVMRKYIAFYLEQKRKLIVVQ